MWQGNKDGLEIEHVKTWWWWGYAPGTSGGANRRAHAGLSRGLGAGPGDQSPLSPGAAHGDSAVSALPLHFPLNKGSFHTLGVMSGEGGEGSPLHLG